METKPLLKRVLVDLLVVVSVAALALGSFLGYEWFKTGSERDRMKRDTEALFADWHAQKESLRQIGSVELDPRTMTLGGLEAEFHAKPRIVKSAIKSGHVSLGWACGTEHCSIVASFVVPNDQSIPPETAPLALVIFDTLGDPSAKIEIGGIRMGETPDALQDSCKKRGYGVKTGYNRVTWDKDWIVTWGGSENKVDILTFANASAIDHLKASGRPEAQIQGKPSKQKAPSIKN